MFTFSFVLRHIVHNNVSTIYQNLTHKDIKLILSKLVDGHLKNRMLSIHLYGEKIQNSYLCKNFTEKCFYIFNEQILKSNHIILYSNDIIYATKSF